MDVLAAGETFFQGRNVGDMGQQPQLDLRVVRADQHIARFGDEGVADAAAFLGADRDVLQVRIGRGQPPGLRDRHRVAGVHAAGLGIDLFHQRIGIGGLQLLQLPPFQDAPRQLVALIGQRLQHGRIRPPGAGLHPFAAGQVHFVEQHLAQLLGRADVELEARQTVAVLFHHGHALFEIDRHAA